jgi:polyhydroxyalkanoate synthesis repressor PhaR
MSEPRVIKKYPNRRLYDTVESRYITLTDVKRLVVEKVGFIVVDKKNNADITGSILLQVISEQEHQGDPLLNREFMTQLIRAYGASQHAQVAGHLDQSLRMFFVQHPLRESPRQRAAPEESSKNVPH